MLILTGKLGSGKSVTMANMVDDLLLLADGPPTIYFFGRHDRPKE
jgi:ankyrin repeat domain-containing protein 50